MELLGYKLTARIIAGLVAIALVVAFLLWGPAACRSYFTQKKEAEVSRGQAGAAINSGAEATNTLGNIIANGAETDRTVKEGQDAIHNANEADRGNVTVDAACKLRAYRDSERCAGLRRANPPADARAHPTH